MNEDNRIPEISDARLAELYARIKPIARFKRKDGDILDFPESPKESEVKLVPNDVGGVLYWLDDVEFPRSTFTYSPKPVKMVKSLKSVTGITTYHTWAYYGLFRPTIAEVLAQIPEEYVDKVVAFETLTAITTSHIVENYHVAMTILYVQKESI